ncbi:DNA-binding transcriptional LysR family regulator [Bradyrhizobium sp. USDA 4461]
MATFDLDGLRTIVLADELQSFARAAAELGRSQSAVSMQLKKLEEQAGCPLFRRKGRGLVATEAGDSLLAYARRILTLHDEAAASIGASTSAASVRMGLPQDFFEDIMPDAITQFSRIRPGVHVEVRAGRNYALEDEVRAGRLDIALAFFRPGSDSHGLKLSTLPMFWFGSARGKTVTDGPIALVLFDHPCLFRQAAIRTLETKGRKWRLALTTPSLPGVWAALRFGHGLSIRTRHRVPSGIANVGETLGLPRLPALELRLLSAAGLSPAATDLRDIVVQSVRKHVRA